MGGRISESPNLHVLKPCLFWMFLTRNVFSDWASCRRWARCLQSPTVAAATCSGGEGGHKTRACGASTLANSPATTTFKQQQQQQQEQQQQNMRPQGARLQDLNPRQPQPTSNYIKATTTTTKNVTTNMATKKQRHRLQDQFNHPPPHPIVSTLFEISTLAALSMRITNTFLKPLLFVLFVANSYRLV